VASGLRGREDPARESRRGAVWNIDEQGAQGHYAAELGDEWTEVEPGIYVRVDSAPNLQVVDPPTPPQATEGVA
jgi:hypothetical protein